VPGTPRSRDRRMDAAAGTIQDAVYVPTRRRARSTNCLRLVDGAAPGSPRRHFLIWRSETDRLCRALAELADEHGADAPARATVQALRAASAEAERQHPARRAFRFLPPQGAERLVAAAAIRARGGAPLLRAVDLLFARARPARR
jgi:hypothetical protein